MKDIFVQFPDGKFHTVQVYKFYTVMYYGKEEYVIEYDDLTSNKRGCFSILDREDNVFVNRPLGDSAVDKAFYNSVRFMYKKPQALYLLPSRISLCGDALALVEESKSKEISKRVQKRIKPRNVLIIYRDIADDHDVYPYYLDKKTAKKLNIACEEDYYHLDPECLKELIDSFDIEVKEENIVFRSDEIVQNVVDVEPEVESTPKKSSSKIEEVIIYEDISPIREEFPFYLSKYNAKRYALKVDASPYYHLKKEEFDVINRYAIVFIEKKELYIIPQRRKSDKKKVETNMMVQLNEKERKTLEEMFDSLIDFEDYYTFFGVEGLRNASPEEVFSSPRMIALSNLFNKGKECGDDLAINLLEFLEGFRKELDQKKKRDLI